MTDCACHALLPQVRSGEHSLEDALAVFAIGSGPVARPPAAAAAATNAAAAVVAEYDTVAAPITAEAPYHSLLTAAGVEPSGGGDPSGGVNPSGGGDDVDLIAQLAAYLGTLRGDTAAFDLDLAAENPSQIVADSAGFHRLTAHMVAKVRVLCVTIVCRSTAGGRLPSSPLFRSKNRSSYCVFACLFFC